MTTLPKCALTLLIVTAGLLFCFQSSAQVDSIQNQTLQTATRSADTIKPGFTERLFRKRAGTGLYTRLYNRFWATDTTPRGSSAHKSSWLAVPVVTYAPETRLNFQAVGLYSFYTNIKDSVLRNSSLYASASYSENHQSRFELKPTFWFSGNKYHLLTILDYQHTALNFYGTGNNTRQSDKISNLTSLYKIDLEGEKLIARNFYAGPVFIYLKDRILPQGTAGSALDPQYLKATTGHAAFIGFNLIYDSRDNQNYPEKGSFINLNGQFSPAGLSSVGSINQYNFDFRHFVSIGKRQVIAIQGLLNLESGSSVPWYFMNQMGNDQIMRGYYQGRFRDLDMLAAQVEYRYLFFPRFGLAAFAGTGEVFHSGFLVAELKPNYGFGGRYLFDPRSRITIRLDYGIGAKPPGEKRISGFYLALGEAF